MLLNNIDRKTGSVPNEQELSMIKDLSRKYDLFP